MYGVPIQHYSDWDWIQSKTVENYNSILEFCCNDWNLDLIKDGGSLELSTGFVGDGMR